MPSVKTAEEYKRLVEEIGDEIVLCRVRVRRWRGRYHLDDVVIKTTDGLDLEKGEDVDDPAGRLLPRAWEKRFSAVESALRAVTAGGVRIAAATYVTLADGSTQKDEEVIDDGAVIPRPMLEKVRQKFQQIVIDRWAPLVNELIASWPKVVADLERDKKQLFDKVKGKLPADVNALRSAFKVSFSERPLGLSADKLTVEALERGAGEYLDALRDSIVSQSAERLKASAQGVLERIKSGGGLKKESVEAFSEALFAYRSFGAAIKAPQEIEAALKKAEAALSGVSHKEINADAKHKSTGLADEVAKVLEGVGKAMDAQLLAAYKAKSQRQIILDDGDEKTDNGAAA